MNLPEIAKGIMADTKIRVGIIGHTGRGNYGHGLDVCWGEIPGVEVVGVADPDPKGLAAAQKKLGVSQGFADYRQLMDQAKPDIVSICQRHVHQHHEMFMEAAQRGISAYVEKPMCRDLVEADAMVAACEEYGVKGAVAHLTRYSPTLETMQQAIEDGAIGDLLEIRMRGKEDRRGGCEDLWVLGSHLLNVVHYFCGEPEWCTASIEQDGRPVTKADIVDGGEGLGAMAGNGAHATYGFANGVKAYFGSVVGKAGIPSRFGLQIFGSKGMMDLHEGYNPTVHYLSSESWCPPLTKTEWVPITSQGIGKPEVLPASWRGPGNVVAAKDLIQAVAEDRDPECSVREGRWTVEMILGAFESHRLGGGPVTFPLKTRKNPFTLM